MPPEYNFRWLALVGLLLLYGFFAIAETSLFSLTPLDRLRLKETRPRRGALVENLLQQSQRLLITLVVGVEVITILASILATSLALSLWGARGQWVALVVMSPLILLLGEVIPKSLALRYPARLAPVVAPVLRIAMWLLAPVRLVLLQLSRGILAALGFSPDIAAPKVQLEDFVHLVEKSHVSGVLADRERDFIQNLLDFGNVRVKQLMVPRPDIFSLPLSLPPHQLLQSIKRSRFSRIPMYQDNPGNIKGILHAKDLLAGHGRTPFDERTIRHLLRPPYYVPENKRAYDLLTELQNRRLRLALVVDEYGSLVGLVTVEDLLEELFGEIPQELVAEERSWKELRPGVWWVKGSLAVTELNEVLGVELPTVDFHTIGGLVFHLFGELPKEGDTVTYEHLRFTVVKMKGTRILDLEVAKTT